MQGMNDIARDAVAENAEDAYVYQWQNPKPNLLDEIARLADELSVERMNNDNLTAMLAESDELPECAVDSIAQLAVDLWRSEQNRAMLGRAMESYAARVQAGTAVLKKMIDEDRGDVGDFRAQIAYNLITTGHVEGRTSA